MAEMNINTSGFGTPETKILEQRADYIKTRHEYKNGVIFIFETNADEVTVHSNYNWIQGALGDIRPNLSSPDPNFIDEP